MAFGIFHSTYVWWCTCCKLLRILLPLDQTNEGYDFYGTDFPHEDLLSLWEADRQSLGTERFLKALAPMYQIVSSVGLLIEGYESLCPFLLHILITVRRGCTGSHREWSATLLRISFHLSFIFLIIKSDF